MTQKFYGIIIEEIFDWGWEDKNNSTEVEHSLYSTAKSARKRVGEIAEDILKRLKEDYDLNKEVLKIYECDEYVSIHYHAKEKTYKIENIDILINVSEFEVEEE